MKLRDEFVKLPEDILYDTYISLVYEFKDYDNITRNKMIDEILKEYNTKKNYLYYICTKRELEFLKYSLNKKLDIKDIKKYEWEIKELNNKCIFSLVTFEVFEEQKENVKKALEYYKENPNKYDEDAVIFMISVVKVNAEMWTKALVSMMESLFNVDSKDVKALLGHPLFNYYCEFNKEYFELTNGEEEMVSYRKYWEILDDVKSLRKEFGIGGVKKI